MERSGDLQGARTKVRRGMTVTTGFFSRRLVEKKPFSENESEDMRTHDQGDRKL